MKTMVFGLTGGIASGKSTVTRLFREEGVPMVDADEVAREVVAPGSPGLRLLQDAFGPVLNPDGTLDRPRLAAIAFTNREKRALLDQILQPLILDVIEQQVRRLEENFSLVGVDAPLLIEKGLQTKFTPVVVVAADPKVQLQRLMARDGFNEAEARARLSSQLPLEEKLKVASFVIWNNEGYPELNRRALEVLAELRQ